MNVQIEILVNVLLAFVAGVIIGYDRERSGKPAGIRTQMLVCVGSALMSSISIFLADGYNWGHMANQGMFHADPERLMAQIVSGIGFLGAGVILKNGNKVVGVTTAATIWITAAIGIGIGSGFYLPSLASLLMVLSLNPIAQFQYRYGLKSAHYHLTVNKGKIEITQRALRFLHIQEVDKQANSKRVTYSILSSEQRNRALSDLLKKKKVKFDIVSDGLSE